MEVARAVALREARSAARADFRAVSLVARSRAERERVEREVFIASFFLEVG